MSRDTLASGWLTALNALVAGSTGISIALNSDGLVVKLTVILMVAQAEMVRHALRRSERERLDAIRWLS